MCLGQFPLEGYENECGESTDFNAILLMKAPSLNLQNIKHIEDPSIVFFYFVSFSVVLLYFRQRKRELLNTILVLDSSNYSLVHYRAERVL